MREKVFSIEIIQHKLQNLTDEENFSANLKDIQDFSRYYPPHAEEFYRDL